MTHFARHSRLIVLTYANRERVDGPAATLALGIALAQPAVAFVAVEAHHAAFEQRRHKAINKPRARANPGRVAASLTCCRAPTVYPPAICTKLISVARILEAFESV